jgi:hypothetical protein
MAEKFPTESLLERHQDPHFSIADGGTALPGRQQLAAASDGGHAVAIERGPLVYALPIDTEWKRLRDRPNLPFDDWEVYPKSPWNYALQLDRAHPEQSVVFEEKTVGKSPLRPTAVGHPFSLKGAPMIAKVKGRRVVAWGLVKGAAAPPPSSPIASKEPLEELTLVPYGCTDLRVTEFPTLASQ